MAISTSSKLNFEKKNLHIIITLSRIVVRVARSFVRSFARLFARLFVRSLARSHLSTVRPCRLSWSPAIPGLQASPSCPRLPSRRAPRASRQAQAPTLMFVRRGKDKTKKNAVRQNDPSTIFTARQTIHRSGNDAAVDRDTGKGQSDAKLQQRASQKRNETIPSTSYSARQTTTVLLFTGGQRIQQKRQIKQPDHTSNKKIQ